MNVSLKALNVAANITTFKNDYNEETTTMLVSKGDTVDLKINHENGEPEDITGAKVLGFTIRPILFYPIDKSGAFIDGTYYQNDHMAYRPCFETIDAASEIDEMVIFVEDKPRYIKVDGILSLATGEPVPEEEKIDVDGETYDSIADAMAALADGSTMTLETDVVLEEDVTLPENANVTILLNGHHFNDAKSITVPATTTVVSDFISNKYVAPEGYVINWEADGDNRWKYTVAPSTWPVTITKADGSVKSYETAADGFNASRDGDTVTLNEDVTVTISLHATDREGISSGNVTVDLNGHEAKNGATSCGGTVMTLKNGTITNGTATTTKGVNAYGGNGTVIVEDGVTVSAGIAVNSEPGYNDTCAEAIINGGSFTGTGGTAIKVAKAGGSSRTNGGKVTVNGGSFTGALTVAPEGTLIINGGSFSVNPTAYVAEGKTVTQDGDRWVVS